MREEYVRHLERTLRALVGLVGKVEWVKAELEKVEVGMGGIFEPELGEARGCVVEGRELMKEGRKDWVKGTGGGLK